MKARVLLRRVRTTMGSAERRARLRAKLRKSAHQMVGPKHPARPVFVAGMQRSGTGMLMNVFHLHPGTAVFDEAADSLVYCDFRIRDMSVLSASLEAQTLPVAAYKVICDSHLVSDLLEVFPDGQVIWMYRRPEENADSQLRKFSEPVRAIKLIHAGEPGGGWLAEGASEDAVRTLRDIDADELSDLDWACLNWWVRNRTYVEQDLGGHPRVRLLSYEATVADPRQVLGQVTDWLGLPRDMRSLRFIHSRSARRMDLPPLHPEVDRLCRSLLASLDDRQRFLAAPDPARLGDS